MSSIPFSSVKKILGTSLVSGIKATAVAFPKFPDRPSLIVAAALGAASATAIAGVISEKPERQSIENVNADAQSTAVAEKLRQAKPRSPEEKLWRMNQMETISRRPYQSAYRRQIIDNILDTSRNDVVLDAKSRHLLTQKIGYVAVEKMQSSLKTTTVDQRPRLKL